MREIGPRATSILFPRFRRQMIDWLELMHRRHSVHGLLEVDVTARDAVRRYRAATGEPLSFTAFIVASLARAVAEDRHMHAYRDGWGRLILFDDVDVGVLVEREMEKERVPAGIVVRAADKADVTQIHREIHDARTGSDRTGAL
ncbi:MAG: hypothetical protein QN178_14560 [Armatimonadota bacterium]|nr:hypothetical protein [Armatimonadota bacterium]